MIRTILLASAFALASPALAQQTGSPPADPMAEPAPQEAPVTEAAPMSETMPTEAGPQDSTTTEAAPVEEAPAETAQATPEKTATPQVAQVVEADFPAYDADKNGELSQTEFAAWMTKLKAAAPAAEGAATAEADVKTWAGQAFAQADVDKSSSISKVELTTFLSG